SLLRPSIREAKFTVSPITVYSLRRGEPTATCRVSLLVVEPAASRRSTTWGETCWPNRLVTKSRAVAAAILASNCRRSCTPTAPARTPQAKMTAEPRRQHRVADACPRGGMKQRESEQLRRCHETGESRKPEVEAQC